MYLKFLKHKPIVLKQCMEEHYYKCSTMPQVSMSCHFWIAQHNFLGTVQYTPASTVKPWNKNFSSKASCLSQNSVHMIFQIENICLNFVLDSNDIFIHSMNCPFNSGVACNTHVSSPIVFLSERLIHCPAILFCIVS